MYPLMRQIFRSAIFIVYNGITQYSLYSLSLKWINNREMASIGFRIKPFRCYKWPQNSWISPIYSDSCSLSFRSSKLAKSNKKNRRENIPCYEFFSWNIFSVHHTQRFLKWIKNKPHIFEMWEIICGAMPSTFSLQIQTIEWDFISV